MLPHVLMGDNVWQRCHIGYAKWEHQTEGQIRQKIGLKPPNFSDFLLYHDCIHIFHQNYYKTSTL